MMMLMMRAVALVLLLLSCTALADERAGHELKDPPSGLKHEEEAWANHRHFITAFGGATVSFPLAPAAEGAASQPEAAFTAGVDYSFRLSKFFGAGVFVDYAFGPLHELLAGPCLFIYPVGGLYLELAPSLELTPSHELLFVGRLAVGYEFEITERFLVGPYLAGDYWGRGVGLVPGLTAALGL